MDADAVSVREARPEDAPVLARIHDEVAQYYPDVGVEHEGTEGTSLRLVAETRGEVVAALIARLVPPDGEAQREQAPDSAHTRLRIEYLVTSAGYRRQGVGSRLVRAAEEWGRAAGADSAETTAFRRSPLSVPFWEERMGYEERSINLSKRL
ncbi:MAG: GNAT family N-acetyltransferase [Actinomycetota bacterium]|nr:GNAT family N-acetyltransferase [Actinomycetota bacterium]